MHARPKEYPRRAVELGDDHALCSIDHKRTRLSHVGDIAEEDILHDRAEVLVVGVRT